MRAVFFSVVLLFSACGSREPTFSESEFPSRVVSVDGVEYGYRMYVPRDRKAGEKLAVMLYLHGSNRRGTDNQSQLADLTESIREKPQNYPYIVVVPQCRPDTFWAGPMTKMAIAALDQTVKEFDGDENRLYIAGYSMGGFGAWQTAITYPQKFAALISVAGGVEPLGVVAPADQSILSPQVASAAGSPDVYRAYAEALKTMPVWLVHGDKDAAVPTEQSRKLAAAFKAAGDPDVNYVELAGVDHGSFVQAFNDDNLAAWLAKKVKK